MAAVQGSRGGGHGGGFHRWVKLSTDDLPLIRPPRHHMLAHMTGGLVHLYDAVKVTKKEGVEEYMMPYHEGEQCKEDIRIDAEKAAKEVENGHVSNGECENGQEEEDMEKHEKDGEGEKKEEGEDKEMKVNENGEEEKEDQEMEKKVDENEKKEEKKEEEEEKNEMDAEMKEEGEETEKKEEEEEGASKEEKEEATATDTATEGKTEKQEKESDGEENSEDKKEENSQNEKKDDEGGGKEDKAKSEADDDEEEEEEEETTPHTDEEGEFSPEKDMLLAARYKCTQVLARGQSAIIIKVLDTFHKDRPLAIKVLHRVYKPIGSQEADILLELHRADPWLHVPFARLLNQFLYGPHYCLVFEYLSPTPLYTHYDRREIREAAALPHIRDLTVKLLTVLGFLYKQNVIHADLKPENILLRSEEDLASLMVVDFGNALRNTDEELSLYYSDFELQTLLYRAPEVIFGMKFSLEVDMWSLGCLLAECYLGEPLFMGKSKKEILSKITTLIGPFPREFNDGEYAEEFAEFIGRPMSRYQRLENLRKRLNDCKDSMFLMLVERLLTYLPDRRFTPFEAACHPFVACSTPFLYLTPSPGYIRYPTVLLDMSTYPYLPGLPDDDDEDSASAHGRKRLALFSRHKRLPSSSSGGQKQGQCVNHKDKDKDGKDAAGGKTATRSDVKETLKSMGLRCEDFTISVYSREQAHAILKRQGVEVTPNNLQAREKLALLGNKGIKTVKASDMPKLNYVRASNTRSVATHFGPDEEDEDEDDDCVILDPPDMPKPIPKLPQQFQLMGTTVQVNRGAKRPSRPMPNQPQAKRSNARPMMYYRNDHEQDMGPEVSVQDTLKRLKNYNISITCRRNASGMRPHGGMMDSESDMENDNMDSDDDGEDMTKYLECQIGEIEDVPEEEIFDDDFDIDCDDKDDVDYTPRGKKRKPGKKSPKKGGKRSSSAASTTPSKDKTNDDSSTSDVTALVPNVEMADLSDHHSEDPEQDPLGADNEDAKELRDILESATHLEEEEEENNQNTNQENETKEAAEENQDMQPEPESQPETFEADTSMDKEAQEEEDDDEEEEHQQEEGEGEGNVGTVEEEEEEEQSAEDALNQLIEAGVSEAATKEGNTAGEEGDEEVGEEEEEIDEELEKRLLGGNIEDGEDGEMEDL
ncbi:uncharacterized protein LOC126999794 isoform X2 [Eriocheir sinensis]|uniref:uncharacterized protein LOC126999794 isoform X2 n=1 Tax=Eriocheir sinensis TaxID=95602 RepID=UPI0021CA11AC|nr:uncharacterized protein LOC126999794 isoform X2 [Eriocheir sinensis]